MTGVGVRLFVGDDWAEDHHDVEVMDEAGKVLAKRRLPEGVAGIAQLHQLIGRHVPGDAEDAEVVIGIETDRGPWVAALTAAGYTVYAVNPLQAARYRDRHAVSGAKSDAADAHTLAEGILRCSPLAVQMIRHIVTVGRNLPAGARHHRFDDRHRAREHTRIVAARSSQARRLERERILGRALRIEGLIGEQSILAALTD